MKTRLVLEHVIGQIVAGCRSISGIMLESFLEAGNQPAPRDSALLKYGISITDKCIDWQTTEQVLQEAHDRLKACGGRQL